MAYNLKRKKLFIVLNRILKDSISQDDNISCQGGPLLLQAIVAQTPSVFSSQPLNRLADNYQDPQGNEALPYLLQ